MEAALPLMGPLDARFPAQATALRYAVEASACPYTNTLTAVGLLNPAHLHQRRLVLPHQPVALSQTPIYRLDGPTTDATLIMPMAEYYRLSSRIRIR